MHSENQILSDLHTDQEANREYRYDAFISYRHLPRDMAIAERLQRLLENYHPPRNVKNLKTKRIHRVFLDHSELPVSSNLGEDIHQALEQSRYLILICSPALLESKWCMAELDYFRAFHGNQNTHILPLLIEGEPKEAFPLQLRWEEKETAAHERIRIEIEPLSADIRENSQRAMLHRLKETEFLRIAAPILGCRFDDLYQRHQRKRHRQVITSSMAVVGVTLGLLAYSMYWLYEVTTRQNKLYVTESTRLASLAEEQTEAGNYRLAMLLARQALPNDLDHPEKPLVQEAEAALRSAVIQQMDMERKDVLLLQARVEFDMSTGSMLRTYAHGTKVALQDGKHTFLCDLYGKMLFSCTDSGELYFNEDATRAVSVFYERERLDQYKTNLKIYNTETGKCYFSGQFDNDTYGIFHESTGDCYVVQEEYTSMLETGMYPERILKVPAVIDTQGNNRGAAETPQWIYDRFEDGYTTSNNFFRLKSEEPVDNTEGIEWVSKRIEELTNEGYITFTPSINSDGQIMAVTVLHEGNTKTKLYSQDGSWEQSFEGNGWFDSDTDLFYSSVYGKNVLDIYSCHLENLDNIQTSDIISWNEDSYWAISSDGEKYLDIPDAIYSDPGSLWRNLSGEYTVCLYDTDNLKEPLLSQPIFLVDGYGFIYYTTPDMKLLFAQSATDRSFGLWDVESGTRLLTFEIEQENAQRVTSVAIDKAGTSLAIAYYHGDIDRGFVSSSVEVRSAADGVLVTSYDMEMDTSSVTHMEFNGTDLLVCTQSVSKIIDLSGGQDVKTFPEGNSGYDNCNSYLTENGLLFCTEFVFQDAPRVLTGVYDINSGKHIFGQAATFQYNESSGALIYQESFISGNISTTLLDTEIHVAYQNNENLFEDRYTVTPQNERMRLWGNRQTMDENYFVLNREGDLIFADRCEVYEITTGNRVMTLKCGPSGIVNGTIYDMQIGNSKANTYPILLLDELLKWSETYLTSENGIRELTEWEMKRYFISNESE